MSNRTGAALAVAAWLSAAATASMGATTTTVVDIPAATGGIQRFLHTRPDAPIGTLVNVPGNDGVLGIVADGSMNTVTGQCGPVGRNRAQFASQGIASVLVDATSNGVIRDYSDVLAVVNHLRARDDAPIWVIGGSSSTGAIEALARALPGNVGVVFFSPVRPSSLAGTIKRPTLVVYHSSDPLAFGNSMYNALTGAIVRERSAITAGTDVGCGFHLFNGADAEFTAAVSSFVQRHGAATASQGPNYQGLWWRSPAGSESGWGVNLTHQANTLFATWFTYDADGRGMWLVVPSGTKGTGETYTGAIYRTTGPAYNAATFDPALVASTQVGSAVFSFVDGQDGSFSYTVGATSQTKSITRQVYAAVPECVAGGSHGASPNYQALWWGGPTESGWGVNVSHQGDTLFATWFTYDTDGRGLWLVMPSGARSGPGTYSGAFYRTTGPAFSATPWSGAGVAATEVGSGSFVFSDAEHGTFTYSVAGVTRAKPIVRQVFASPATVCR